LSDRGVVSSKKQRAPDLLASRVYLDAIKRGPLLALKDAGMLHSIIPNVATRKDDKSLALYPSFTSLDGKLQLFSFPLVLVPRRLFDFILAVDWLIVNVDPGLDHRVAV
jgi:hypothetical protein